MKWGQRKAKSSSTTSTTSGKSRDPAKEAITQRKKTSAARRYISDGDLKAAVERIQTEKKLKDLTNEDLAPGRTEVKKILGQIGKNAITTVGTGVAVYTLRALLEGNFDRKKAAEFIQPKKK